MMRDLSIFGPADVAYLQDVYDHIVRVTDNIDTYRDLLSSALDSYLSLQSNHLNEIVKVLTIASIVLMAASLITGFYGMNFAHMPELRWPIGSLWASSDADPRHRRPGHLLQAEGVAVARRRPRSTSTSLTAVGRKANRARGGGRGLSCAPPDRWGPRFPRGRHSRALVRRARRCVQFLGHHDVIHRLRATL